MPADTPKYGGSKIDFLTAASKVEGVQPVIDQMKQGVKTTEDLTKAKEESDAVDKKIGSGQAGQAAARNKVTEATLAQTKAIEANRVALTNESAVVESNTKLWLDNAAARRAAASVRPTVLQAPAAAAGAVPIPSATAPSAQEGVVKAFQLTAKQQGILISEALWQGVAQPSPAKAAAFGALTTNEAIGSSVIRLQKIEQEQAQESVSFKDAIAAAARVEADTVTAANEKIAASGGAGGKPPAVPRTALGGAEPPKGPLLLTAGPTGRYGYGTPTPTAGGYYDEAGQFHDEPRSFVAPSAYSPQYGPGPTERYGRVSSIKNALGEHEVASVGVLTETEQAAIQRGKELTATFGPMDVALGRVNATIRTNAAELAAASTAIQRHGALSTEFIGALARGEVTLREFGDATVATIGKFGGWAVAGGLVYGAYEALKRITEGAKAASSGVTQLERAALPDFSRERALQSFLNISRQLNVPIGGTGGVSEAEFYATRAGFRTQPEVEKASVTALEAQKLDQVPIQDATKALGALRVAFGLNADGVHKVFEELDVGQLRFNARLNQTLPQLGRAASAIANAGGNVHELAQQLIVVVGATGGGGGTGGGNPATLFIREAGNIRRAEAQKTLTELVPDIFKRERDEPNVTRFNKELAERASKLPEDQIQRLAEAIGGGTAIGGRYAVAFLRSSAQGRLGEVEAQAGKPGDALQQDLGRKVAQFDEQAKKIGITFERLGIEIGSVGLTAAAESTFGLFNVMGFSLEKLASPLGRVGDLFNSIPVPVQQAAIALTALSVAAKLSQSEKLLGLTRPAAEAARYLPFGNTFAGYLESPDRVFVRDFRRTLSEEGRRTQGRIESITQRAEARGPELGAAKAGVEEYKQQIERKIGQEFVPGAEHPYFATAEGQGALTGYDRERAKLIDLEAANVADNRQLNREQDARVQQEILTAKTRQGTFAERAAIADEAGYRVASGSGGVIRGPGGVEGSRYEALLRAGEKGETPPATSRVGKEMAAAQQAQAKAAGDTAKGEELFASAVTKLGADTASNTIKSAAQLRTALGELAGELESGAAQVGVGLKVLVGSLLAGELGAAGRGALTAATGPLKVPGALGRFAGQLTGGGELFKALNTALLGTLGAELIGGAIGGSAGSKISNIGSAVALGAAAGTALPFLTPLGGAAIGGVIGIASELFGGGGRTAAQNKQKQSEEALKRSQQEFEQALGGEETGQGIGATHDAVLATSEAFALQLETAFGEDAKAAEAAQKNIEKGFRVAEANLKLFGFGSKKGQAVGHEVLAEAAATELSVASQPGAIDKSAEILEKFESDFLDAWEKEHARELKLAKSTRDFSKVGNVIEQEYQAARQALIVEPHERLAQKIKEDKEGEQLLEKPDIEKPTTKTERYATVPGEGRKPGRPPAHTRGLSRPEQADEIAANQRENRAYVDSYNKQVAEETKKLAAIHDQRVQPRLTAALPSNPFGPQPTIALTGGPLKAVEDQEKAIQDKVGQLRKELDKLTHLIAARPYQNDAALFSQFKAKEKQITELEAQSATLNELTERLNQRLKEFAGEEQRVADVHALESAYKTRNALRLAEAGPGTAAKLRVQAQIDKEEEERANALTHGHVPSEIKEEEKTKAIELAKEKADSKLKAEELTEKKELAGVPRKDAQERADIEIRNAQNRVDKLKALVPKGAASVEQLEEAEVKLEEIKTTSAERVESEGAQIIDAQGKLEEARDAGDAIKQAQDKLRTADAKVGTAQNKAERLNDEAEVLAARTAIHQAETQRIEERGDLRASETEDPVKKAQIKVETARKVLARAQGPDERLKDQTKLNEAIRDERNTKLKEEEDGIKFEENLHKITTAQAVTKLQTILRRLKAIKAAPAEIRRVEEEIFKDQEQTEKDFAVGSIRQAPTLYDARTLAVRRRAGAPPGLAGSAFTAIHQAPQLTQHNVIHINVTGEKGHFAREMETVFGGLTRSQLRSAGLT